MQLVDLIRWDQSYAKRVLIADEVLREVWDGTKEQRQRLIGRFGTSAYNACKEAL